jgi:hypothetical protein
MGEEDLPKIYCTMIMELRDMMISSKRKRNLSSELEFPFLNLQ